MGSETLCCRLRSRLDLDRDRETYVGAALRGAAAHALGISLQCRSALDSRVASSSVPSRI